MPEAGQPKSRTLSVLALQGAALSPFALVGVGVALWLGVGPGLVATGLMAWIDWNWAPVRRRAAP